MNHPFFLFRSRRTAVAGVMGLLLAGCAAVGPNFTPPQAQTPADWQDKADPNAAPAPSGVSTEADPDPRWWLRFNDPTLTSLMDRATRGNLDVRLAMLRIDEARANELTARAGSLPTVNASAARTKQGYGDRIKPQPVPPYEIAADASWELDLFGKVRRMSEQAKANTEAAIGNRDDALVSIEAEVAQTYAQLRAAQAGRRMTEQSIANQAETLALTRDRAEHGLTTTLDVENSNALLQTTQSQSPQYDQQIKAAMSALAMLVGEAPGSLDAELSANASIPAPPPDVPIGLPASLARRRPDIRAAEAQLHAQTAQIGVAVAQLYPDISLSGEFGFAGAAPSDLTRWGNHFFTFGPSISLPIFDGGRLKANVTLAKTGQQEAAITYRKTVLSALQDVENALTAYRTEQGRRQSLQAAVASNQAAVALAHDAYAHGLSTFINVLTAEKNLVDAQQQLVQSTMTVTTDLVTLYKALGGGWEQQTDRS